MAGPGARRLGPRRDRHRRGLGRGGALPHGPGVHGCVVAAARRAVGRDRRQLARPFPCFSGRRPAFEFSRSGSHRRHPHSQRRRPTIARHVLRRLLRPAATRPGSVERIRSTVASIVAGSNLYRPELTLTRQEGCVGAESRVADVVVGIWGTTMCALAIRDDISPEELRRQARRERDGRVSARLIAIANALEGMDRASAARLAGMDRQTLRDWVHRYNAEGIAGLCNRPAPGRRPKLSEGQMAALKAVVLAGPDPAVDKVTRWRIVDLCRWVEERWGVSYSDTGMLRVLWSLDLSHRKTRPRHPQSNEKAQQAFKKRGLLLA